MIGKLKFYGRISEQGNLILDDTKLFQRCLKANAGKDVELILQKPQKAKTKQQLAFLFGAVVPVISEYTGYSDEETYALLKQMFLVRNAGTKRTYIASLSQLNKDEVNKFISECVNFAEKLNITVTG